MNRTINFALALLTLAGPGLSQTSSLLIYPPSTVYASDTSASFFIGGRNIENDYPDLTVLLGGVDVTSQVAWSWSNETRVDLNGDGWLDSFAATADVDISQLTIGHTVGLEVEAVTDGVQGAPVEYRAGVQALSHSVVGLFPRRFNVLAPPTKLSVFLSSYGVPVTGVTRTVSIWKDGVDITTSVVFTQSVLSEVLLDSGLIDWRGSMLIVTSSLGVLTSATDLEVKMDVSVPGKGQFSSGAGFMLDQDAEELPCAGDALCALVAAAGISQAADGSLSLGTTDCEGLRDALSDLKDALRDCQTAEAQGKPDTFTDLIECDGLIISVELAIGGNGGSPKSTEAGSPGSVNKLVIAIGGDGTGGQSGAPAEVSVGDGGIGLAMGGSGSQKGFGGRGGGNAAGESTVGAFGGTGGEDGGQGGNSFSSCEETGAPGSVGIAAGGPGGDSGPASNGGHGGGAGVRSCEGDVSQRSGGPKEGGAGGPGQHGSGACAQADKQGNASAQKGTSEDNT